MWQLEGHAHNVSLRIHYRANLSQIPTEKSTVRDSISMEKQFYNLNNFCAVFCLISNLNTIWLNILVEKSGIWGQRLGQYFTEEYVGLHRTTMA